MAEQETTSKGTQSSSSSGSQRSTGPFSSFTNPFRKGNLQYVHHHELVTVPVWLHGYTYA